MDDETQKWYDRSSWWIEEKCRILDLFPMTTLREWCYQRNNLFANVGWIKFWVYDTVYKDVRCGLQHCRVSGYFVRVAAGFISRLATADIRRFGSLSSLFFLVVAIVYLLFIYCLFIVFFLFLLISRLATADIRRFGSLSSSFFSEWTIMLLARKQIVLNCQSPQIQNFTP